MSSRYSWKRPSSRIYSYNLELGEHYYSPMTSYLHERVTRPIETPGALTYSERLARKWIHGRQFDYRRSSSMARDIGPSYEESSGSSYLASNRRRAVSEIRTTSSSSAYEMTMAQKREEQLSRMRAIEEHERQMNSTRASSSISSKTTAASKSTRLESSRRDVRDDVCKRVADLTLCPYEGKQEIQDANSASARARARILELEAELEAITMKAMTTRMSSLKTASQMASEARMEEESQMRSQKKTRKVMTESRQMIATS